MTVELPSTDDQENEYRYERKYVLAATHASNMLMRIKLHPNGFREKYSPRCVNNLYFDTLGHASFFDNVEGAGGRTKLRVRWYGDTLRRIDAPILEFKVKRGVVVNEYLQTSDTNIFAIGEIAEFRRQLFGITTAAEQQARCLAGYIAGDLNSSYNGSVLMNVLKFEDLDLCSIGQITFPDNTAGYEEVVFQDITQGYYKKCIIYQDRMVGAILVGDKAEFPEYKRLIEQQIELSEKRTELLRNATPKALVLGKLICSCNNIGKGNLENAIAAGFNTLPKLCEKTGAGTACGSCKPELKELLKNTKYALPIPGKNGVNGTVKKKGLFSSFFR